MASERWFGNFAAGNLHDVGGSPAGNIVCDGGARTGDFSFYLYAPTTSGGQGRVTKPLVGSYTCTNDGASVIARMQVAIQCTQYVGIDDVQVAGFSIGTTVAPAQDCRISMKTTGLLSVQPSASNSGARVTAGTPLVFGKWYILRLHYMYTRNDAGLDHSIGTLEVYDADTIDTDAPVLVTSATSAITSAISNFAMSGIPTLGSAADTAIARVIRYNDWWWAVASDADAVLTNPVLAWPRGSRIVPVEITSQQLAQWTGAMQLVQDVPNSAVAGNEQTSAAAGLQSTFGHATAVALGLIPVAQLTPDEVPEAPPFTGQSPPGNLWVSENYTSEPTLPLPTLVDAVANDGAGLFQTGVWVSAATVRYYQPPGATPHFIYVGPRTTPIFIDGTQHGNYSIDVTAAMNPATPDDAFTIPGNVNSAYNRYGIVFFVYGGFNASGQWDPFTNLTGLQTLNGARLVAVYDTEVNRAIPYSNTHPEIRPLTRTARFLGGDYTLLTSDLGGGLSGSGGTNGQAAQFYQVGSTTPIANPFPIVSAVKVYANIKRTAGSGTDDILINSTATSVASGSSYITFNSVQYAIDWTPRTADQFDALTFGVRSGSASATQLGNIIAEVMTAGPTVKRANPVGKYQQKCGVFTSNNGFLEVPVGFRAGVVLVKRIGTTAAAGAFKAWWMGGTQSWPLNSVTPESIAIMKITDTGFVVGPANNANGVAATYAYIAIRDGAQDVVNGAYTLTGSYQRVTGVGAGTIPFGFPLAFVTNWTPTAGFIIGSTTTFKDSEMTGANSLALSGGSLVTDALTAFGNGSFTIGANSAVAAAGQYPYLMLREDAGLLLSSVFAHGTYAGTGGVLVVPTPFAPEFTDVTVPNGVHTGRWRSTTGNTGNNSVPWLGGAVTTTDITAVGAASFTLGAGSSVSGQTGHWFIFKGEGTFGNEGGPSPGDVIPPDSGGNPPGPGGGGICAGGGLKLTDPTVGGHGCVQC